MSINVLKKLTVKAVVGKLSIVEIVSWAQAHDKQPMPVLTLLGIAEKVIVRESPYPDDEGNKLSVGFKGTFKAIRPDGKHFVGPVLFAPSVITENLKVALANESATAVEFGFVIAAQPSSRDDNKYEFVCESIHDMHIADPLEELTKRITLRLPNPAVPPTQAEKAPAKKAATQRK
jgi:hypothetical protein